MSEKQPESDVEDEPEIQLADPDDYHRTQRLKEIHKARREVNKARREIKDKYQDKKRAKDRQYHRTEHMARHVHQYAVELEPVIAATQLSAEWPERLPWGSFSDYLDDMGFVPADCPAATPGRNGTEEGRLYPASAQVTTIVFRHLNQVLAEVKPLIEEDENDEWEV